MATDTEASRARCAQRPKRRAAESIRTSARTTMDTGDSTGHQQVQMPHRRSRSGKHSVGHSSVVMPWKRPNVETEIRHMAARGWGGQDVGRGTELLLIWTEVGAT